VTTALAIANAAVAELGLPDLATLYGATANATERQMGALLNRVCKELNAEYEWTRTMREQTFYLEEPFTLTGDVVAGSRVVTNMSSTSEFITAGASAFSVQNADGTTDNINQATRVDTRDSTTQITLNQAAIASGTAVELEFVRDTYELNSAMSRYISDTWWDRSNHWRLIGPISPQTDEFLRSGIVQTGPRRRWRQLGNGTSTWQIWPPPFTSGQTPALLAFEFITLAWATDLSGTAIETMTADTDVPVFPEHVLVLGLKAAFWRVKGFDWQPMYADYVEAARRAASQDGSKATLQIGDTRGRIDGLLNTFNVPDGNFPGPGFGGTP